MPYIDNEIPWDLHAHDCPNPSAKRLYIRDYNDKGTQCFIKWGVTCPKCGVTFKKNDTTHKLTNRQKWALKGSNEIEDKYYSKLSIEEGLRNLDKAAKKRKLKRYFHKI